MNPWILLGHVAQMLGYLNITGLKTALLLNFKDANLGIKCISYSLIPV